MKKLAIKSLCVLAGLMVMEPVLSAKNTTPHRPAAAAAANHQATTRPAQAARQAADEPSPRDAGWLKRHEGFVTRAKQGNCDLLFLGDSITDFWNGQKPLWEKSFGEYKPVNFGISGDQTQHVLYRITNGELDGITPKVTVIMIGTNNEGGYTPEQIAAGVTKICTTVQTKLPDTKILLLAIFPRGEKADNPMRAKIKATNDLIAKLDDGKKLRYLDFSDKFLETDGTMSKTVMGDFLHPTTKGYQIWADNMKATLDEMMK